MYLLQGLFIPSFIPTWPSSSKADTGNNQDPERGGIADRPNDMPDVFHTVFGIAGLSLLGYPGLREVDPK